MCMYVCIYIYIYLCIYCVCIYIYIYVYIFVYIYIYIYIYIYVYNIYIYIHREVLTIPTECLKKQQGPLRRGFTGVPYFFGHTETTLWSSNMAGWKIPELNGGF